MDNTIQMTLPQQVHEQMLNLISEGWFRDENDLIAEALRRFMDVYRPELMDRFIREDVEWGLHGEE